MRENYRNEWDNLVRWFGDLWRFNFHDYKLNIFDHSYVFRVRDLSHFFIIAVIIVQIGHDYLWTHCLIRSWKTHLKRIKHNEETIRISSINKICSILFGGFSLENMLIASTFIDSYAIDHWGATNAAFLVTHLLIFAGVPKYS